MMIKLTSDQKENLLSVILANRLDIADELASAAAHHVETKVAIYSDETLTHDAASPSTPDADENVSRLHEILEDFFAGLNLLGDNTVQTFINNVVTQAKPVMQNKSKGTTLWDRMKNVPSLKGPNRGTGYDSNPYSSQHDSSGRDLIAPFQPMPTMRGKPVPIANSDGLDSIVRLADAADDNGMHSHADILTNFMPLMKVAQYEGFQQYCVQNSRAFQKAVREKLDSKSMHDAWWDTLEEYQKSLMGEQEDFLSKYAEVDARDDYEVGSLFMNVVRAKLFQGEHPGVAIMETFDEIASGKAFLVEAAKVQDVIDEMLMDGRIASSEGFVKEASWWDNIKNMWGGGGQGNPAALAKRIQKLWATWSPKLLALLSQQPQAQEEPFVAPSAGITPAANANHHIKTAAPAPNFDGANFDGIDKFGPKPTPEPNFDGIDKFGPKPTPPAPPQAKPAAPQAKPTQVHYNDFLSNGGNALISPMFQFTTLVRKLAPHLAMPAMPDFNAWAKTGWLPMDKYHDMLLQMERVVKIASDSGTVRDLEMAAQNPAAIPQSQPPQDQAATTSTPAGPSAPAATLPTATPATGSPDAGAQAVSDIIKSVADITNKFKNNPQALVLELQKLIMRHTPNPAEEPPQAESPTDKNAAAPIEPAAPKV